MHTQYHDHLNSARSANSNDFLLILKNLMKIRLIIKIQSIVCKMMIKIPMIRRTRVTVSSSHLILK